MAKSQILTTFTGEERVRDFYLNSTLSSSVSSVIFQSNTSLRRPPHICKADVCRLDIQYIQCRKAE